jgi:hypothetical protein
VSLRLFTPVLDGIQKLGIYPGQARQLLSVELIGLTLLTVDQPGLARIGYHYLVAQAFEDPVHPARVSADFDGDLQLLLGVEAAAEVLRGGAQPALLNELATTVGVEHAQITVLVAEVQPYRHLRLLGATIIHGSILLSGPLTSPYLFADPLTGYCARIGPSHLIYSATSHCLAQQLRY